jgi:hypothetical protein
MELTELHGSMVKILFLQPLKVEVADERMKIKEAGHQMVSWNNYCLISKNILQDYRLLGIIFNGIQELH